MHLFINLLTWIDVSKFKFKGVSNGGGCVYVGAGSMWERSVLPTHFGCEPKIPLKSNLY